MPEAFVLPPETVEAVRYARANSGRIVAVGTTTTRVLESVSRQNGVFAPARGETDLTILPGHRFQVVDALITNFHLPRSSLLLLVCAFAGRERVLRAYADAIRIRYRFYSYGDAMLII
jgi:S-adenosylmethionine:tRNA ribosyltransferase-isomerase